MINLIFIYTFNKSYSYLIGKYCFILYLINIYLNNKVMNNCIVHIKGGIDLEKILILGASGLVGKALCNELKDSYKVYGTYNKNKVYIDHVEMIKFEIKNPDKVLNILNSHKPNKIIISLTGNYEKQFNVIKEIVNYSEETNSIVYFISTWNVFDAYPNKIYYENDEKSSNTDYGKFKIKAENFLLNNIENRCVIFRLPMIWGKNSPRLNKLKENLNNNEPIEVVTNMFLNHNTDEILAKQIHYILQNHSKGIFHLGSADQINHFDFIKNLTNKLGYKNVKFKEVQYGDCPYTVALGSKKYLPKELQVSVQDILEGLI